MKESPEGGTKFGLGEESPHTISVVTKTLLGSVALMADRPDLIERLYSIAKDYEAVAKADGDAEEDLAVSATIREAITELLRLGDFERKSKPPFGGVLPVKRIHKMPSAVA
ncbi:hypothetical protein ACIKTA_02490 [Hansschlegelia beijingensis]